MATANNLVVGCLSLFFGVLTIIFARNDIRLFRMRNPTDRLWWLYHHISYICGSFIAAFTAFLVQNNHLIFPRGMEWIGWVLPTVIGAPVISRYIRKYKRKGKSRRRMTNSMRSSSSGPAEEAA